MSEPTTRDDAETPQPRLSAEVRDALVMIAKSLLWCVLMLVVAILGAENSSGPPPPWEGGPPRLRRIGRVILGSYMVLAWGFIIYMLCLGIFSGWK